MTVPKDWPTMREYVVKVRARFDQKTAHKVPEERAIYAQQLANVREAAAISGITDWTEEHTIGALFATSSLLMGIEQLRRLHMVDDNAAGMLRLLVEEQEHTTIGLAS